MPHEYSGCASWVLYTLTGTEHTLHRVNLDDHFMIINILTFSKPGFHKARHDDDKFLLLTQPCTQGIIVSDNSSHPIKPLIL